MPRKGHLTSCFDGFSHSPKTKSSDSFSGIFRVLRQSPLPFGTTPERLGRADDSDAERRRRRRTKRGRLVHACALMTPSDWGTRQRLSQTRPAGLPMCRLLREHLPQLLPDGTWYTALMFAGKNGRGGMNTIKINSPPLPLTHPILLCKEKPS